MSKAYELKLSASQQVELEQARDHHGKPYVREKAAGILKVAAGQSIADVARHGLLRQRTWETVYDWLQSYEQAGLAGLLVKVGRGRKASFSPNGTQGSQRGSGERVE